MTAERVLPASCEEDDDDDDDDVLDDVFDRRNKYK
jgi:hypothetical protein